MENNWLQIIATILGSGITSALLTGLWLNERTERIKTEFQRNLYEFQTKFSLLHNKRAEVIENMFELLSEVQNDIQELVNERENLSVATREVLHKRTEEHFDNVCNFYDKKRIYFENKEILMFKHFINFRSYAVERLFDKNKA